MFACHAACSHRHHAPVAQQMCALLAAQARLLAKRLGPLADGFPRSIMEAVKMHRVPAELEPDLMCAAGDPDPDPDPKFNPDCNPNGSPDPDPDHLMCAAGHATPR